MNAEWPLFSTVTLLFLFLHSKYSKINGDFFIGRAVMILKVC